MKVFPGWFENRDKGVRTEASAMVVEMYRWIGKALNNALEDLSPVQVLVRNKCLTDVNIQQVKELQEAFEKLPADTAVPVKYMRSQAPKPGQVMAAGKAAAPGMNAALFSRVLTRTTVVIDPYDLSDEVEIVSKIKDEWFTGLVCDKGSVISVLILS